MKQWLILAMSILVPEPDPVSVTGLALLGPSSRLWPVSRLYMIL